MFTKQLLLTLLPTFAYSAQAATCIASYRKQLQQQLKPSLQTPYGALLHAVTQEQDDIWDTQTHAKAERACTKLTWHSQSASTLVRKALLHLIEGAERMQRMNVSPVGFHAQLAYHFFCLHRAREYLTCAQKECPDYDSCLSTLQKLPLDAQDEIRKFYLAFTHPTVDGFLHLSNGIARTAQMIGWHEQLQKLRGPAQTIILEYLKPAPYYSLRELAPLMHHRTRINLVGVNSLAGMEQLTKNNPQLKFVSCVATPIKPALLIVMNTH